MSFYSKQRVLNASLTVYDRDGAKHRLKGIVSQQEAFFLLQEMGKDVHLRLNGPCPQTAYEIQNNISPATQFMIPPAKRKLDFDDDDEQIMKMIKIE